MSEQEPLATCQPERQPGTSRWVGKVLHLRPNEPCGHRWVARSIVITELPDEDTKTLDVIAGSKVWYCLHCHAITPRDQQPSDPQETP